MKKVLLFLYLLLATTPSVQAQVAVGKTDPKGMLDLSNENGYGIIFPKVALTATNVTTPVTNPNGPSLEVGTTVYNTNKTTNGPYDVYPGIYAWNGSSWVSQYLREDSAIFTQNPIGTRVTNSGSYIDVPSLGSGSTFTAKYSGTYRIKANFNFGAGTIEDSGDTIDMATQEGYFRFTFNGTQHLIYTHAYSIHNANSGLSHEQFRHDTSLILYETLTSGQTYNFQLEIDMFVSSEFENGGDSGDGRAWVGIGIPCTVEFTYLEE